jgi:hypothetical protein
MNRSGENVYDSGSMSYRERSKNASCSQAYQADLPAPVHSKSLQHAMIAAETVGDNAKHMSGWLYSTAKEAFQLVSKFQYCSLL